MSLQQQRLPTGPVLVTGAAGFLGNCMVKQLVMAGLRVMGVDRNPSTQIFPGYTHQVMDLESLDLGCCLATHRPWALIHCAGRATVAASMRDPAADFAASVPLTFVLLETVRKHNPETLFLYFSSAAVYGNPARLPVNEQSLIKPLSPYGIHKHQCELLCQGHAQIFGLHTASLRIFSAYGPGLKRQVLWDVCRKAWTNHTLQLHGTGSESRDFIHGSDVARAALTVLKRGAMQGETYNVATGVETSIQEAATQIIAALPARQRRLEFNGVRPPGTPERWRADIARVQALGFAPEIELTAGIRSLVAWAQTQFEP